MKKSNRKSTEVSYWESMADSMVALVLCILHTRYWDYSGQRMNLGGHVCLMSALTWAAFAVAVVCILHPLFQPSVSRIPESLCGVMAGTLAALALGDAIPKGLKRRRRT